MKRIHFIASDPYACGHYRCFMPDKYLNQSGKYIASSYFGQSIERETVLNSNIVVLQRQADPAFFDIINMAHSNGGKVIFDLDDNLWAIPNYNYAVKFYNKHILGSMAKVIAACDAVTVSTKPLGQFLSRFNRNMFIIKNRVETTSSVRPVHDDGKVRIGWAGSPNHGTGDFDSKFLHAVKEIMNKYPQVQFEFMGYIPPALEGLVVKKDICDVKVYIDTINTFGWDIGLAPIADNYFNICKSNLKWLEWSMCNIPTIASNVYPYTNSIVNGTNGFLATKSTEWISAMSTLIENVELRKQIAKNAYEQVRREFCFYNDSFVEDWDNVIASIGG